MFENLQVFQIAHMMARHAGSRHAVISRNMANADTPGYKAQDIADFKSHVSRNNAEFHLRASRRSHLNQNSPVVVPESFERPGSIADPNGNSVSIESEMMHAVNAKRQHDRALAIYRSSMTILRSAIGRR
jgi:flagellar basal-body rod protein FlgB